MNKIEIEPVQGLVNFSIQPPGSKSITNRAMLCAALASGNSVLLGVLDSDDTRVMITGLGSLGVEIKHDKTKCTAQIQGCGGSPPKRSSHIDVEGSGTTIRFLTAALAGLGGSYQLDGIERMRSRPIGDLTDTLRILGAGVTTHNDNGFPPVTIQSEGIFGGSATVAANISSQFLSGLLMAAPLSQNPVELTVDGELVSRPYVDMTVNVMKRFGVEVQVSNESRHFLIEPQTYQACDYSIEPDASAASYFWGAAAICGGRAEIKGLNLQAMQGDVKFVECLEKMGCQIEHSPESITVIGPATRSVSVDMGDISDTVQTLAAVSLFVPGTTKISNIAHNRVKETDRIGDLATELRKLGANVKESADGLEITSNQLQGAEIKTYNDHRMAMSLSLVGLKQPGVVILDPGCVSKTYPNFFPEMDQACRSQSSN